MDTPAWFLRVAFLSLLLLLVWPLGRWAANSRLWPTARSRAGWRLRGGRARPVPAGRCGARHRHGLARRRIRGPERRVN